MRILITVTVATTLLAGAAISQPKLKSNDPNVANQKLMALSEVDRRKFLFGILGLSHEKCGGEVTRTFYQGSLKPSWNAMWDVTCKNGLSFIIMVMSDERGSTRILTCGELRAAGGGECFRKLE